MAVSILVWLLPAVVVAQGAMVIRNLHDNTMMETTEFKGKELSDYALVGSESKLKCEDGVCHIAHHGGFYNLRNLGTIGESVSLKSRSANNICVEAFGCVAQGAAYVYDRARISGHQIDTMSRVAGNYIANNWQAAAGGAVLQVSMGIVIGSGITYWINYRFTKLTAGDNKCNLNLSDACNICHAIPTDKAQQAARALGNHILNMDRDRYVQSDTFVDAVRPGQLNAYGIKIDAGAVASRHYYTDSCQLKTSRVNDGEIHTLQP